MRIHEWVGMSLADLHFLIAATVFVAGGILVLIANKDEIGERFRSIWKGR